MSGDVQPRKRKEKKKKKEDGSEEIAQQLYPYQHNQQTISDDVNIHVEKEASTGGGVCAKIVFFILLTALAVLIGLIITEHRELTDLDTVDTESRFSKIFASWTENTQHDGDNDHLIDEVDFDTNEESDSGEKEENEDEEDEKDEETVELQEDEEDTRQDDDNDDESENLSQLEEEDEIEEDEQQSEETYEEDREESEEQQEEETEGYDSNQVQSEEINGDDNEDADDDDGDKEDEDESYDKVADSEEEIIEKQDESKKKLTADEDIEDVPPQTSGTGSDSGNSAKITKDDDILEAPVPDLSRRNTIVPPPSLEEVEPDMENVEEEYLIQEEGEEESDENNQQRQSPVKKKYRELQTTYSRSFTKDDDSYYHDNEDEEDEEEDDCEEEEEDEEVSQNDDEDDDDEELLKKLEAKYGKLRRDSNYEDDEHVEDDDDDDEEGEVDDDFFTSWKRVNPLRKEADESDSEKEENKHFGSESVYDYANITNTADYVIKDELDEAQKEIYNNTAYALELFDVILHNHPLSPRALYGKAQTLDALAERQKSNEILHQAISTYIQTINAENVPDVLFQKAAERCIQRMHFIGSYSQAINIHQKLINRFPDIVKFRNQLAITYLTINNIEKARRVLQETLIKWPNDGVALVHYGFILKTADNKLKEAAYYMRKGLKTRNKGVIDGRFYFHLGDALTRLGRTQQAMDVYEEGVKENVFLSKYQRSLYNVARLKGKPWWRKKETPYENLYKNLETHWKEIRNEGLAVLNEKGYFKDESENLKDVGDWKQFELYARGVKNKENCKKCPVTCQIIANFPDASGCKRGQSKFSVMHPGTHVWPHCGPTNCRLRVHLGLKVPPKTYLRVAEETRSWEEGKVFIFDDSFEHEVWHNGTEFRLVLIVDIWHPELTAMEKKMLTPI